MKSKILKHNLVACLINILLTWQINCATALGEEPNEQLNEMAENYITKITSNEVPYYRSTTLLLI